ncbi:sodium:calcium antiporter [Arhodomonas sp. AD133]|uniref:sodium:calcium antiporter n=1 Tax=Arhodomonas sp. AD133 TaxID=3415009 RepID=UPI003EBD844D
MPTEDPPLLLSGGVFVLAAAIIALLGTRLSDRADRFADRTGLGEAVVGAVMLGAMTSLPGIVACVTLALDGRAAFAVSAATGGIAVQTAFLAIADAVYQRANLEHAAASVPNMLFGALLVGLLSLLLLGINVPDVAIGHIHPASLALPIAYIGGMHWVHQAHQRPMWHPRITHVTERDVPDEAARHEPLGPLALDMLLTGLGVAAAGWAVAWSGEAVADATGLNDSLIGGTLVAISTSLPELVTTVAAVRQGALTLAVSGILGGNAFDTLFVAVADVAYRPGPIFADISQREPQLIAASAVMSSILLLGLMRRERSGPANVGVETLLIAAVYALVLLLLARGGG